MPGREPNGLELIQMEGNTWVSLENLHQAHMPDVPIMRIREALLGEICEKESEGRWVQLVKTVIVYSPLKKLITTLNKSKKNHNRSKK